MPCQNSSAEPRCPSRCFEEAGVALRQDGFAVVRSCVDGVALGALVDEYEREVLPRKHKIDVRREVNGPDGKDGLARVVHISNVCELPALAHLAADPRLLALASACLGGAAVTPVINTEIFDKPPDGNLSTETPPHQDNFYFNAKEPGVALWIALDRMGSESGGCRYVHGSHLRGLRYHEFDWGPYGFAKSIYDFTDEDDELLKDVGSLEPGDVVIHHGLTVHYAPPNLTPNRRRGLVVNYVAEHVAYSLTDDLYRPALQFLVCEGGALRAPLQKSWAERHALAASCVMCALAGCREMEGGIQGRVRLDADELFVEVGDPLLRRLAVMALVRSGHVVRGVEAVRSMPLRLGSFAVPALPQSPPGARPPSRHAGAWTLVCEERAPGLAAEPADLALRLQTPCGLYVDIRIPKTAPKGKPDVDSAAESTDADSCADPAAVAEQHASAGVLSVHGEDEAVVVRHRRIGFHPFDGAEEVGRSSWQGEGALVETSMPGLGRACTTRTWRRLGEPPGPGGAAALELVDERHGRLGFWVVAGAWFGRVVGRRSGDVVDDAVCKSLQHAIQVYAEGWDLDPGVMVRGFEASFGRVEAPGVLRIVHDFERDREGSLLLDASERQLRRDAADDGALVEAQSNWRWRIRELPASFTAFGQLKRAMA